MKNKPSEGTTPQAERPKFDDLCDRCITATHCIVNGCCLAEARAVAPVETRLTAEQFFEEWRKLQSYPDLGNADWPYRFAEAFRDKSESGLRVRYDREHKWLNDAATEAGNCDLDSVGNVIRGLREEIERLKEAEKAEREFLERDYGISEIPTLASMYDAAIERAEAAEAEVAALRERERWIPVSERWPQANEFVHVVIGGIFQTVPARLIDDRWYWFIEEADTAPKDAVTHWKALSAAPEAKK